MSGLRIWSSKNCSPNKKNLEIKKVLLKLRKNSHEVMIDNCYKLRAALQVTAREEMTIFWRSAPFRTTSHDFRKSFPGEVVISKSCRGWCATKFDQLDYCARSQKNLETTDILSCLLKIFSTKSGSYNYKI